jgi:ribose 5-phosphate isomerase
MTDIEKIKLENDILKSDNLSLKKQLENQQKLTLNLINTIKINIDTIDVLQQQVILLKSKGGGNTNE